MGKWVRERKKLVKGTLPNQFLLWHFWPALNAGKADQMKSRRCWQRNVSAGVLWSGRRYKQPLLQHHSQSFPFRQTLAFSYHISVQFSSVTQLCPTHCMDCSMPGLPVHHQVLEFTQTHVHWVGDAIQPSHPVIHFSLHLQSFPASGSFPMSHFFTSSG